MEQYSSKDTTIPSSISLHRPTGILAIVQLAAFHQKVVDPDQLIHALGLSGSRVGIAEIILAAQELGLKAADKSLNWGALQELKLPFIAETKAGEFVIVGRSTKDGRLPVSVPGPRRQPKLYAQEDWHRDMTGRVVLLKERLSLTNPNRPFGFLWFVPILKKYRKELFEVLIAAFAYQLLGIGIPIFVQVIIDKVFIYHNYATLVVIGSGMFVVILFNGIFNVLQTILLAHVGNRVDVSLGSAIYSRLVRIPLRYFEQRRVGDTIARVRQMDPIRNFLTGHALLSLVDSFFVFIYIAILLFYSVHLTAVVLLAILLMAISTALFRPALRARLEEKFDSGANSQAFLVETVTGVETVKAMALEANMSQRWERLLAKYVTAAYQADWLNGIASGIARTLQNLTILAILWFGAGLVLNGTMMVGALIAFQMLASRAMAPMLRVTSLWQQFQQIGISVRRLGDLMDAPVEPVLDPGKSSLPMLRGSVRFEHVSFRYHAESPRIIEDVSFDITESTTVGIVGRSGSGKSTLAKLIQRLYVPESGRVLVDGYDLLQVDPGWLRRQIGVVPQESFLFGGSIRENISVRFPGASISSVIDAARLAGAHDFIAELSQGYDTQVGERGVTLSGGQRQRIAIARALITNPRIIIFDEATSALDYESERIIQKNLSAICKGRTVFLIAHRISMLRNADRILVMDRGKLVEQGSHSDLIKLKGLYEYLYSQQGISL